MGRLRLKREILTEKVLKALPKEGKYRLNSLLQTFGYEKDILDFKGRELPYILSLIVDISRFFRKRTVELLVDFDDGFGEICIKKFGKFYNNGNVNVLNPYDSQGGLRVIRDYLYTYSPNRWSFSKLYYTLQTHLSLSFGIVIGFKTKSL